MSLIVSSRWRLTVAQEKLFSIQSSENLGAGEMEFSRTVHGFQVCCDTYVYALIHLILNINISMFLEDSGTMCSDGRVF